jgi:AcrR family transcriptional regulator
VPRLSRVDSQKRTRQQLVRTATELFLRDGYFATSLDRVADAAGYSKGAVYSNFASKDELCLAVLDAVLAERAREIARAVVGATSFPERVSAVERWAESMIADGGWSTLEIEFGSQVRSNPALGTAFAQRASSARAVIAEVLSAGAAEAGRALPLPADELATAVLALGLGLAAQRSVDPSVSVRALGNTIRVFAGLPVVPA